MARVVVWFSCGAASAVAAKLAVGKYRGELPVVVVYCDTSANECPDNARFKADVERWIGQNVVVLSNPKFKNVEEVFEYHSYMAGIKGAKCTIEMKKIPRLRFAQIDDINVFGFTSDEKKRIKNFEQHNPELILDWVLRDSGITKRDCFVGLQDAGIELPVMYTLGYKNNNCIGCVKATSPAYWNLVRQTHPEVFQHRAEMSRRLGVRLTRLHGKRIFLDELPRGDYGRYKMEDISCGPDCRPTNRR